MHASRCNLVPSWGNQDFDACIKILWNTWISHRITKLISFFANLFKKYLIYGEINKFSVGFSFWDTLYDQNIGEMLIDLFRFPGPRFCFNERIGANVRQSLKTLIDGRSFLILEVLDKSPEHLSWLVQPPDTWELYPEYRFLHHCNEHNCHEWSCGAVREAITKCAFI